MRITREYHKKKMQKNWVNRTVLLNVKFTLESGEILTLSIQNVLSE